MDTAKQFEFWPDFRGSAAPQAEFAFLPSLPRRPRPKRPYELRRERARRQFAAMHRAVDGPPPEA